MVVLKIRKIGNSLGAVFPKELLVHLGVQEGENLYPILDVDGGLKLVPYDPDFAEQMDAAREIMQENKEVLKELSK